MSKLARALAVGVLLTAMSLGGNAYAQDGEAQPQPSAESVPQDPDTPEDPAGSQDPTPPEDPGASAGPSSTPGPTTTTHPPVVVRPESLPVTVSPRAGGPGTTVTVRTDLRGCTRPGSAQGFFLDRLAYGVDGASRRLVRERVTGGRWYSAQYLVTNRDAVGRGQFGVVCDKSIVGFTN
jgi:hypothetical protein